MVFSVHGFTTPICSYRDATLTAASIRRELRIKQFDKLKTVLDQVSERQVWKNFLKCVEAAGYVSKSLIILGECSVYSYALYLIGRFDYGNGGIRASKGHQQNGSFMAAVTGIIRVLRNRIWNPNLRIMRGVTTGADFSNS